MLPTTDTVSTQPTVPTARDKFDAPLSLARKQTDVTPVLHQFEDWVTRTGYFLRLVQDGSDCIKGTVYASDREDLEGPRNDSCNAGGEDRLRKNLLPPFPKRLPMARIAHIVS